jgi:sialate O-acetylesterase
MIHAFTRLAALAAALLLAAQTSTFAQPAPGQAPPAGSVKVLPFVNPVFGDNMVLQRGKPAAIWGL